MKRPLFIFFAFALNIALFIQLLAIGASAHSGGTDSNGGHYDHSTGEYHYHHGRPAHNHYDIDGDGYRDCPYEFDDESDLSFGILEIIGLSLLFLLLTTTLIKKILKSEPKELVHFTILIITLIITAITIISIIVIES